MVGARKRFDLGIKKIISWVQCLLFEGSHPPALNLSILFFHVSFLPPLFSAKLAAVFSRTYRMCSVAAFVSCGSICLAEVSLFCFDWSVVNTVTRSGDSRARLLDTKTWESNFNVVLLAIARRLSLNYNYCLIISDLLHNLAASRVVLKYPKMERSDEQLSENQLAWYIEQCLSQYSSHKSIVTQLHHPPIFYSQCSPGFTLASRVTTNIVC